MSEKLVDDTKAVKPPVLMQFYFANSFVTRERKFTSIFKKSSKENFKSVSFFLLLFLFLCLLKNPFKNKKKKKILWQKIFF